MTRSERFWMGLLLAATLNGACKVEAEEDEIPTPTPVRRDAGRPTSPMDGAPLAPGPDAAAPIQDAGTMARDTAVAIGVDALAVSDVSRIVPQDTESPRDGAPSPSPDGRADSRAEGDAGRVEGTVTKAEDERFFWISTPGGLMRFEATGVCGFIKEDDAVLFLSQPLKGCKASILTHIPSGKPCEVYCI